MAMNAQKMRSEKSTGVECPKLLPTSIGLGNIHTEPKVNTENLESLEDLFGENVDKSSRKDNDTMLCREVLEQIQPEDIQELLPHLAASEVLGQRNEDDISEVENVARAEGGDSEEGGTTSVYDAGELVLAVDSWDDGQGDDESQKN